jgi:effector-binding domain-containing protein
VQKILYGITAFVGLLILIGFALPSTHRIEVSTEIDAPQATVFALVNDFRRFTLWAPWTGLTNLRILAESLPSADFSDLEIEHLIVEPVEIAYLPTHSRPEASAMSEAMGAAYFEVLKFIDANGLQDAGAPLSITKTFVGAELLFDAGIPVRGVTNDTPRRDNGVRLGSTYGGPVIRIRHVGSYWNLSTTHRKIAAYLSALGIERNGDAWESYVSDPGKTAEAELVTLVYYPVRPD